MARPGLFELDEFLAEVWMRSRGIDQDSTWEALMPESALAFDHPL